MKKLTTKNYWEQSTSFQDFTLPQLNNEHNEAIRRLIRRFQQFLPRGERYRFLEIGCAPGRWMISFAKLFGYQVTGIEYVPAFAQFTKENLQYNKVRGHVVTEDVFQTTLPAESFDVVFSDGLIEHFDNLTEILRQHVKLTKPGGFVVVNAPNLKAIPTRMTLRMYGLTDVHYPVTLEALEQSLQTLGLEPLFIGYIGGFNPGFVDWAKHQSPAANTIRLALTRLVGWALKLFPFEVPQLSPHVLAIGRKTH